MAKKSERDLRRGWGSASPESIWSHWFIADGPKGRPTVSACGRVFFGRWSKIGWDTPSNACPNCKTSLQMDSIN